MPNETSAPSLLDKFQFCCAVSLQSQLGTHPLSLVLLWRRFLGLSENNELITENLKFVHSLGPIIHTLYCILYGRAKSTIASVPQNNTASNHTFRFSVEIQQVPWCELRSNPLKQNLAGKFCSLLRLIC
jgi:hypothetical protein